MKVHFEDFRPPEKKPPKTINLWDIITIAICSFVFTDSIVSGDYIMVAIVAFCWELYENKRRRE